MRAIERTVQGLAVRLALAVALALVLGAAGCGTGPGSGGEATPASEADDAATAPPGAGQGEHPLPTASPGASPGAGTGPGAQAPPDQAGPNDQDHEHEAALPVPTWDQTGRAAALDVALQVMHAFARPTADEATWWGELEPLLSPAAAEAYQGTDPTNIPAHAVTGAPTLAQDQASAYLATVQVPTDAGTYTVLLSRPGSDQPWRAERITPPSTLTMAPPSGVTP